MNPADIPPITWTSDPHIQGNTTQKNAKTHHARVSYEHTVLLFEEPTD